MKSAFIFALLVVCSTAAAHRPDMKPQEEYHRPDMEPQEEYHRPDMEPQDIYPDRPSEDDNYEEDDNYGEDEYGEDGEDGHKIWYDGYEDYDGYDSRAETIPILIKAATTQSNTNKKKDLQNVYDNDLSTFIKLTAGWIQVHFQTEADVTRVEVYVQGTAHWRRIPDVYLTGDMGHHRDRCDSQEGYEEEYYPQEDCYVFDCYVDYTVSYVTINSESTETLYITEIKVYEDGGGDVWGSVATLPMWETTTTPTTEEPYQDMDIKHNVMPVFLEKEGVFMWEPEIDDPIPYNIIDEVSKMDNATQSPLGFLAFAGYVDYSLAMRADEGDDMVAQKRSKFTNEDLKSATSEFLKFNGYVETGEITDEMIAFMKTTRCGNPDVTMDKNKQCQGLSQTQIGTAVGYGVGSALPKSQAFYMPHSKFDYMLPEAKTYYFEADVKFTNRKRGKSRAVFIGYNYNKMTANGNDTPLEMVAVRFMKNKLCAQFVVLSERTLTSSLASAEQILNSCYTLTKNDEKTLTFKIRVDIYKEIRGMIGRVLVTVRGHSLGETVYKTKLTSSAVMMFKKDDHVITTSRVCKRDIGLSQIKLVKRQRRGRKKRFVLANSKWTVAENTLRFNFQNYSTVLGQEKTRQGVLGAIEAIVTQTGLSFTEVEPGALAEVVFMFIRGRHADGKIFYGSGAEKAHAYTPMHSEIHFNDHEEFSLSRNDNTVSMFYVALHELGHSLGLLHSEKSAAVMNAPYVSAAAFATTRLDSDDIYGVRTLYPDTTSGGGSFTPLRHTLGSARVPYVYEPRLPLPTQCHYKIDAALSIDGYHFLISGTFIWKVTANNPKDLRQGYIIEQGYPKRVTDVFTQAYGRIEAMFKVQKGKSGEYVVYVLHGNKLVSKYPYNKVWKAFSANAPVPRSTFFGTNIVDIKSAFDYGDKTILVAEDLMLYYEVTWKNGKSVKAVSTKQPVKNIIGRQVFSSEFNAVMGLGDSQGLIFQREKAFIQKLFPGANDKVNPRPLGIPEQFGIAGWCKVNVKS